MAREGLAWICHECTAEAGSGACVLSEVAVRLSLPGSAFPLFGEKAHFCYAVGLEGTEVRWCRSARVRREAFAGAECARLVLASLPKPSARVRQGLEASGEQCLLPGTLPERGFVKAVKKHAPDALAEWQQYKRDFLGMDPAQVECAFLLFRAGFCGDAVREGFIRSAGAGGEHGPAREAAAAAWREFKVPRTLGETLNAAKARPEAFFSRLSRPPPFAGLGEMCETFFRHFCGDTKSTLLDFPHDFLVARADDAFARGERPRLDRADVVGPLSVAGEDSYARREFAVALATLAAAASAGRLACSDAPFPPGGEPPPRAAGPDGQGSRGAAGGGRCALFPAPAEGGTRGPGRPPRYVARLPDVNVLGLSRLVESLRALEGVPLATLVLHRYFDVDDRHATPCWLALRRALALPGPREAGPPEAGPPEAGPPEAGPPEAGPPEAAPVELPAYEEALGRAVATSRARGAEFVAVPHLEEGAAGEGPWRYSLLGGFVCRRRTDGGGTEAPDGTLVDPREATVACPQVDGVTLVPARCLHRLCSKSFRLGAAVLPANAPEFAECMTQECRRVSLSTVALERARVRFPRSEARGGSAIHH